MALAGAPGLIAVRSIDTAESMKFWGDALNVPFTHGVK